MSAAEPKRPFFPVRVRTEERAEELLRQLFPSVVWKGVIVHDGLPWFARRSFAVAMALPRTWARSGACIYFKDYQAHPDFERLSILVHEAYHAAQYRDLEGFVLDFGYFRGFTRYYFGWYIALFFRFLMQTRSWSRAAGQAYNQHPMELPAYAFEAAFAALSSEYGRLPVAVFVEMHPELVRFRTEAIPSPPFWAWFLGAFFALLVALVKPLTDVLMLPIVGIAKLLRK